MKASVIIPAYNSSERLYFNLISLNCQDCGREQFEVIVINNGSTDDTMSMLSSFKPEYEMRVLSFRNNRSRAAARNAGIRASQGEVLIFHDSDMIASKRFISSHLLQHRDEKTVVCGPGWRRIYSFYYKEFKGYLRRNFISGRWRYKDKYSDCTKYDRVQLLDEEELKEDRFLKKSFILEMREDRLKKVIDAFGKDLEGYNFPWRFFMTNNSSIHKGAVIEAGLFDENYIDWGCEDLDFAYRLYRKGYSFRRAEEAVSVHQEHPVSKHQSAADNIAYFTGKYNSIDLMLFYYGRFDILDELWISYALYEFNVLKEDSSYSLVSEAIPALLSFVRERCISFSNARMVRDRQYEAKLMEQVKKLYKNKTFRHISKVFSLLYKEVYGIDPERLLGISTN